MSYLFKQPTKTQYDDVNFYIIGFESKSTNQVETFACQYREELESFSKELFTNDGNTDRLVYIKEYR